MSELGARAVELWVPDAQGRRADVLVGGAEAADGPRHYFGAVVGRCANRIARGELPVDGRVHHLLVDDGGNTLHGGPEGFDRRRWTVEHADASRLELSLVSPDGDQGFPGEVRARVRYEVAESEVRISLEATTDAATVVNLTQHAYVNLAGAGTIDDHALQVAASSYTPVGEDLLPTGAITPVDGTDHDLRAPRTLRGRHLDVNLVLDDGSPAAVLTDPASGRTLTLLTDQPGLQVYTADQLADDPFPPRAGVALEPQLFPDSPHHVGEPGWPDPVLRPGETYRSAITWRFGTTPDRTT